MRRDEREEIARDGEAVRVPLLLADGSSVRPMMTLSDAVSMADALPARWRDDAKPIAQRMRAPKPDRASLIVALDSFARRAHGRAEAAQGLDDDGADIVRDAQVAMRWALAAREKALALPDEGAAYARDFAQGEAMAARKMYLDRLSNAHRETT